MQLWLHWAMPCPLLSGKCFVVHYIKGTEAGSTVLSK